MAKKKKLILVGNEPIETDALASAIDAHDFVVRVNRMTNFGATGVKTNGVFLGMYHDFIHVHKGGEHQDVFGTARQFFSVQAVKDDDRVLDYISAKQRESMEVVSHFYAVRELRADSITSAVLMLRHLLNSHWADEYEIWVTALTIDGRGELLRTGEEWKGTSHAKHGDAEERWLKSMVESGKVKVLK